MLIHFEMYNKVLQSDLNISLGGLYLDRQGALHMAEELDAGGVASLHVLVVRYLRERERGSV